MRNESGFDWNVVEKVVKNECISKGEVQALLLDWNQGVRERGTKDAFKGSGLKNWLNRFAVS